MYQVIQPGSGVNQDIIKEYQDCPFQQWFKNRVYQALEGRRGIGEAKRNYQKLIVALMCFDSCFWNIMIKHPNLMISRP